MEIAPSLMFKGKNKEKAKYFLFLSRPDSLQRDTAFLCVLQVSHYFFPSLGFRNSRVEARENLQFCLYVSFKITVKKPGFRCHNNE